MVTAYPYFATVERQRINGRDDRVGSLAKLSTIAYSVVSASAEPLSMISQTTRAGHAHRALAR